MVHRNVILRLLFLLFIVGIVALIYDKNKSKNKGRREDSEEKGNTEPYSDLAKLIKLNTVENVGVEADRQDQNYSRDKEPKYNEDGSLQKENYICGSPEYMRCSTNDSCSQYGIGEICDGPIGASYCICNTKIKKSVDGVWERVTSKREPGFGIVSISVGGVCTDDSQCETGVCTDTPGIFSKSCKCPEGKIWDVNNNKCVNSEYPRTPTGDIPISITQDQKDNSIGATNFYEKTRDPPRVEGVCSTNGKFASSTAECSIGETLNPTGFCTCVLINPGLLGENLIDVGGRCSETSQCANNMICGSNVEDNTNICKCPTGMKYNWNNKTCECPNPTHIFDYSDGKCKNPRDIKRELCPNSTPNSTPNSRNSNFCSSNSECGLGELCNPSSMTCYCKANLHNSIIGDGGLCSNNSQCKSGKCEILKDGLKYCKPDPLIPVYNLGISMYSS